MRIFLSILSAAVAVALIYALNMQLPVGGGKTPRSGYFLSPQKGFWQNAENNDASFNMDVVSNKLNGTSEVYLDDRLVPHVYADNEHDVYFIQGYMHAKFRLWQMEFQTHIAAGRLSEIRGKDSIALKTDKFFRRLGKIGRAHV